MAGGADLNVFGARGAFRGLIVIVTQREVHFEGGTGEGLRADAVNVHGQRCRGTLGVPGTAWDAVAFKMECTLCGYVYGSDGVEVPRRRCPNCQQGAPGVRFWLLPRDLPGAAGSADRQGLSAIESSVGVESAADWINRIAGTFQDDPGFEEMVRLGREFRQVDRPTDDAGS